MEAATYADESAVEADHWWFKGRRLLFGRILRQLRVARDARILDAGTSSGTNLRLLRDSGFSNYVGLDINQQAIELCAEKGLGPIRRGDVCAMPFEERSFDFIFATDIIEHVESDDLALGEITRILKPGAYCLITVPAFPSLWGHQDIVSHHKRRYRQHLLLDQLVTAGLLPVASYHFNYLLFMPIWLARISMRMLGLAPQSENRVNAPLLNIVLYWLFSFDVITAPHLKPPFGVSVLALCKKDRS